MEVIFWLFFCSVNGYIATGLDKNIINPEKGTNVAQTVELWRLSADFDERTNPNLACVCPAPENGQFSKTPLCKFFDDLQTFSASTCSNCCWTAAQ